MASIALTRDWSVLLVGEDEMIYGSLHVCSAHVVASVYKG